MQKYKALLKTVECGSFTKAAQILQYSQSGISRMIGDLEREWGVRLLERSRTGVLLTSDGMQILPYAKRVCAEYDRLQMQVDALHGIQTGTIRIGTFSSVATHWLPNIIRAFQQDCPHVDYELLLGDYTEIETWIQDGRVDCGFLRLPTRPEFETIELERDRLMAILPENHRLAGCARFPIRALEEEPSLLLEKGGKAEIAQVLAHSGVSPQIRFTTWDDYAVMSMVECGLGISILPELILRRVPYRIVARELDVPAYRRIGLAMRSRKTCTLALQRFLAYLDYRNGAKETEIM